MSIPCAYASHTDARKAGWFSRRHQTDGAHREAQDRWRAERTEKLAREQQQRDETSAYREAHKRLMA